MTEWVGDDEIARHKGGSRRFSGSRFHRHPGGSRDPLNRIGRAAVEDFGDKDPLQDTGLARILFGQVIPLRRDARRRLYLCIVLLAGPNAQMWARHGSDSDHAVIKEKINLAATCRDFDCR